MNLSVCRNVSGSLYNARPGGLEYTSRITKVSPSFPHRTIFAYAGSSSILLGWSAVFMLIGPSFVEEGDALVQLANLHNVLANELDAARCAQMADSTHEVA